MGTGEIFSEGCGKQFQAECLPPYPASSTLYEQNLPLASCMDITVQQNITVKDDLSHKGNSHVRANGDFDDVENVQSLKTPRLAKNEQLWEEVLRIFQKDGMIERLEALLVPLDTTNTGTVSSEDFIAAITRSELISLRLTEFLRDQREMAWFSLVLLCLTAAMQDGARALKEVGISAASERCISNGTHALAEELAVAPFCALECELWAGRRHRIVNTSERV
eukprot:766376-Hanusia_phi.AAC.1